MTIFGYGSLMDVQSCRQTLPTAQNFRRGELPGYRRSYNLVSIGRIKSGEADLRTMEVAALSIGACASCAVLGCLFEIPPDELGPYLTREHRYKALQLQVRDLSTCGGYVLAWTVLEQTDDDYVAKLLREGLDWEETIGRYYKGQLWGRADVLPLRKYMIMCVLAACSLGGTEFVDNMLDGTVLADGVTPLRTHVQRLLREFKSAGDELSEVQQLQPLLS